MSDRSMGFRDKLLEEVPQLRAFARSLCRQPDKADDLVQDTLLKAWEKQDSLRDDTAMRSWLFTILRHQFYAGSRRSKFEVEDEGGVHAQRLCHDASQEKFVEFHETLAALNTLPSDVRDAMVLVCVNELTYEQAAEVCGCVIGTLKSRVNRGRTLLKQAMSEKNRSVDQARSPVSANDGLHLDASVGLNKSVERSRTRQNALETA